MAVVYVLWLEVLLQSSYLKRRRPLWVLTISVRDLVDEKRDCIARTLQSCLIYMGTWILDLGLRLLRRRPCSTAVGRRRGGSRALPHQRRFVHAHRVLSHRRDVPAV